MICGLLVGFSFSDTFLPNPHQSLSSTPTYTDLPTPRDDMDPSDSPGDNVGSSGNAKGNVGLTVAVMAGALLLALVVVGVPLTVIMVIKMRKKSKQRKLAVIPNDNSSSG